MKKCCFAGHKDISDENVRQKAFSIIEYLVKNYGVNIFLVGNYGAFDRMIAGILNEIKKKKNVINIAEDFRIQGIIKG